MTSEENLQELKRAVELLTLRDRRNAESLMRALTTDYRILRGMQKDLDEYIEEMSLGGKSYREKR